jgi:flagellar biosynthesis protein FlhF
MAEMTLKTYRARSMADALTEVKKDLGRDAVILHTRSYKVGGWFGVGARPIVEITASAGEDDAPQRARHRDPAATSHALRRAYSLDRAVLSGQSREMPTPDADAPTAIVERPPAPRLDPATRRMPIESVSIERELEAIRHMVGRVLHTSHTSMAPHSAQLGAMPDALFTNYLKLLEADAAGDIVEEIIGAVRDELSGAELRDAAAVRAAVIRRVADLIPVAPDVPAPDPPVGGRPLTIAMIGPTGVGKTTTVAKLAAAYKLRHARRVGLVTTDTYRIAAVDQLRTYANIIGVPLKVAMTPAEMSQACQSLANCDVILLDTAGRSQNDAERLAELRQFLDAAEPDQTHLLLSCTSNQRVLLEAARRFGDLSPNRVVFTKLDEAVNYGVLLSVAKRIDLELSYVTTGQEVPDHIEVAQPERLARLVLDGTPPRVAEPVG